MAVQMLAQMAVPVLLEAIKTGLARIDHPAAAGAEAAIDDLQRAVKNGHVSPEQMAAAQGHFEQMARIEMEERKNTVSEVNQSLRTEVSSDDAYVRRMRPTFGYMMAVTWGAQMLAVAYVIVRDPTRAGLVLNAMESLGTIWAVALSVMGIYVYQRSTEKKAAYDLVRPTVRSVQPVTEIASEDRKSRVNKNPDLSYND